jgi:hypothetical protein
MAELAAIPWSYAAAVHLGIDPEIVFHEGGYRGQAAGLLTNFALGVGPGVHLLVAAGLTEAASYPRMTRWLRA